MSSNRFRLQHFSCRACRYSLQGREGTLHLFFCVGIYRPLFNQILDNYHPKYKLADSEQIKENVVDKALIKLKKIEKSAAEYFLDSKQYLYNYNQNENIYDPDDEVYLERSQIKHKYRFQYCQKCKKNVKGKMRYLHHRICTLEILENIQNKINQIQIQPLIKQQQKIPQSQIKIEYPQESMINIDYPWVDQCKNALYKSRQIKQKYDQYVIENQSCLCQLCGKCYKNEKSLKRHQKLVHQDQIKEIPLLLQQFQSIQDW